MPRTFKHEKPRGKQPQKTDAVVPPPSPKPSPVSARSLPFPPFPAPKPPRRKAPPTPPAPVSAPPARPAAPPQPSLGKEILYLFLKIAGILLTFVLLSTFLFGFCRCPDVSMDPAIKDGDLVVFYRLDKRYVTQDTVVLEFNGQKQMRRIVATAGDTVDITEAGLVINGALQQETKIYSPTHRYEGGVEFPLVVQEGQVFVLGDNRVNCTDSRVYGAVSIQDTLGKVMTVLRRRGV